MGALKKEQEEPHSPGKLSFCRAPVSLVLMYGKEIPFDIYIKLSDSKLIKLRNRDEDILNTLKQYVAKGVKEFYISKEDYLEFIQGTSQSLSHKFFNPQTVKTPEESLLLLNDAYEVVKESFKTIGVTEEALSIAREVGKQAVKTVEGVSNIFILFKDFKENCSEEFMHHLLLAYTLSCVIDQFPWGSSATKEKMSLAAILCDVTLSKEDFQTLKDFSDDPDVLPEHIREHPIRVVELLQERKNSVPKEVIDVIELHHELPNGKGFPRKVNHVRVSLLAALFIVTSEFVDELQKIEFDFGRRSELMHALFKKYHMGNFRKAIEAIAKLIEI